MSSYVWLDSLSDIREIMREHQKPKWPQTDRETYGKASGYATTKADRPLSPSDMGSDTPLLLVQIFVMPMGIWILRRDRVRESFGPSTIL